MGQRTRLIAVVLLIIGALLLIGVVYIVSQTEEPPPVVEGDVVDEEGEPGTGTGEEGVPAALTPPPLVEVVVSLQTVPRGWLMTEDELTTDLRRVELVGDNVITSLDDVVGKYARTDIYQGETLTRDSVIEDPTQIGLLEYGPSSLIPEGYVAQAVPMDRLSSVAYGYSEGDLVDILITFTIAEVDEEFQSLLENSATFIIESVGEAGEGETAPEVSRSLLVLDPYGRFETLPNGNLAYITPSEEQRPLRVSFVLQAAKVIQVGPWIPREDVVRPTPTPTPDPAATPTPEAGQVPTPTPPPPDVVLLALTPQQQLVLKYAEEVVADIDFALRPPNDTQIYGVDAIDLADFLGRFEIDLPIDFGYTANPLRVTVTPTAGEPGEEQ